MQPQTQYTFGGQPITADQNAQMQQLLQLAQAGLVNPNAVVQQALSLNAPKDPFDQMLEQMMGGGQSATPTDQTSQFPEVQGKPRWNAQWLRNYYGEPQITVDTTKAGRGIREPDLINKQRSPLDVGSLFTEVDNLLKNDGGFLANAPKYGTLALDPKTFHSTLQIEAPQLSKLYGDLLSDERQ